MDVEESPATSAPNSQPSAEVLSQIEVGADGLTAIQRAFKRKMKGKWLCSNCNSASLNKYPKCHSCGIGIRPAHIQPPKEENPFPQVTNQIAFPKFDATKLQKKTVPLKRPGKSPFDSFQFKPQGLPTQPSVSEDAVFNSNTPKKSDPPKFNFGKLPSNPPVFNFGLGKSPSSGGFKFDFSKSSDTPSNFKFDPPKPSNSLGDFKFEPPKATPVFPSKTSPDSINQDSNENKTIPPFPPVRKERLKFQLPSTPVGNSKNAINSIFGNKPLQTSNIANIKGDFLTNQPSPATHLSSMSINPFELNPGKMCEKLKDCLNEARQSNHTDFILACGYGGMGSTGLGDIPDEEVNPEEGSDAEMEDEDNDEEYVDPYEASVPTMIALPNMQWSDFDCGAFNAGCVSSCGSAYVWGTNDHGNLGVSNSVISTQFEPMEATFPEKVCIRKIGMGGSHTVFCDSKGQVWTAGTFKSDGEVGHHFDADTGTVVVNQKSFMKIEKYSSVCVANMRDKDRTLPPIVDVQSGADHFLMLDDTGHIWEMGVTVMGQRSSKRNQSKYLIPRKSPLVGSRANLRFTKIRCGSHFNLAISREGDLYSWGQNMWMQCGHPRPEPENEDEALEPHQAVIDLPTKIQFPVPVKIVDCSAGEHFAIALDSFGRVYSWGRNASNTLGRETKTPAKKENQDFENECLPDLPQQVQLPPIKKIAAGPAHWFVQTKSGSVHAFGVNTEYRTGLGLDPIDDKEKVEGGANGDTVFDKRNLQDDFEVVNISGGSQHSLFHLRKTIRSGNGKRKMSDEFYAPAAKLGKV